MQLQDKSGVLRYRKQIEVSFIQERAFHLCLQMLSALIKIL